MPLKWRSLPDEAAGGHQAGRKRYVYNESAY